MYEDCVTTACFVFSTCCRFYALPLLWSDRFG
ncbi:unnamed protein product [Linum tenue]|uniref:Uncharacterized protein n=1 Tax=Linum tenue TaxID=586396 RepID=A0AAV0QGF5_9ROSI|nr:unnamed protein product [Linum tenue]